MISKESATVFSCSALFYHVGIRRTENQKFIPLYHHLLEPCRSDHQNRATVCIICGCLESYFAQLNACDPFQQISSESQQPKLSEKIFCTDASSICILCKDNISDWPKFAPPKAHKNRQNKKPPVFLQAVSPGNGKSHSVVSMSPNRVCR